MAADVKVGVYAAPELLHAAHAERRRLIERIAASGLDHVFVPDHVSFFVGAGMDGLIQAATLTALEPNLEVVVGVYLLALRHPVPVARQIATLSECAPGRLVLGVGVGGEDRHEIEICGVDPRTRGRRTDESLAVLRALLAGQPVSYRGEFFEFERALILPAPDPRVPILIGGRADAALQRTARHGDGWLAAWTSPKRFAAATREIEDAAVAAGRESVAWQHGLQLWVGVDDDRSRARERLAAEMESFYRSTSFEQFERYSPYGTPAEIADALAAYVAAGCRRLNITAVTDSPERAIDAVAEIRERLRSA